MRHTGKRWLRALALMLMAALMLTDGAALAESFSAVVATKNMIVAADAEGKKQQGTLSKNTVVRVLSFDNGVAQIRYSGRIGYALLSDMVAVESISTQAVTNRSTYAYKNPSKNSSKVKVKKGVNVNVLAVKGEAAMVEREGVVAYMNAAHLTLKGVGLLPGVIGGQPQPPQQEAKPQVPALDDAYVSGKYSNEEICYLFLRQVMGYNNAAAAGVVSNIYSESTFVPTLVGDGGTSYGICQWHASRRTRLETYCAERGYDVNSLPGQLMYLKYELETYYPKVHRYMLGVENSAQGAYDAAYYFCYNFEGPANRENQSVKRGSRAQDTYYPKYAQL